MGGWLPKANAPQNAVFGGLTDRETSPAEQFRVVSMTHQHPGSQAPGLRAGSAASRFACARSTCAKSAQKGGTRMERKLG